MNDTCSTGTRLRREEEEELLPMLNSELHSAVARIIELVIYLKKKH